MVARDARSVHLCTATVLLHDLQSCVDAHNQELREDGYLAMCAIAMRLHAELKAAQASPPTAVAKPPLSGRRRRRGEDEDEDEVEVEDEDEDEDEGIMAVNGNEAADGEVWEHNTRLVMTRRGAAS